MIYWWFSHVGLWPTEAICGVAWLGSWWVLIKAGEKL